VDKKSEAPNALVQYVFPGAEGVYNQTSAIRNSIKYVVSRDLQLGLQVRLLNTTGLATKKTFSRTSKTALDITKLATTRSSNVVKSLHRKVFSTPGSTHAPSEMSP
jgi:hypothetical protein